MTPANQFILRHDLPSSLQVDPLQSKCLRYCRRPKSVSFATFNPIPIEDIGQDDNAHQVVNVRPIHNGEDIQLSGAHAFERQMKRLVGMDVRKILRID